jgi:hypothetical protein
MEARAAGVANVLAYSARQSSHNLGRTHASQLLSCQECTDVLIWSKFISVPGVQ